MLKRLAAALLVMCAATACITDLFRRSAGYDQRPLLVQTLALFNQRTPSRLAKRSWKGDWIFRRDRLEMVDQELRNSKPDILALQEVMARRGSSAESDARILRAGALSDYDWREATVEQFEDTQETQSMVLALGVPFKFIAAPGGEREAWVMGAGGYLQAATIEYEDQPVTFFNVQMPQTTSDDFLWYSFLQERIVERLARLKLCGKRVIVTGHLPGDEGAKRFADFLGTLQLKDAAAGFCQIDSRCYTATPTNDIFMATVGDESPTRVDRVFLHRTALVYSSARNFEDNDPNNRYAREFGLSRLWPSQRFGWTTSVRLARCRADEHGAP